ncbi:hypothetical protein F8M41_021492 [Gigaspora margarita]|uniref:Uncharacterized protein n=1 Tax=Gigaspora margarita TaxID=4874 RepID=A0A8H4EIV5_GIGMA|nr:hypothetical protein F8M41_021492 [Gigaspora margarita]
MSKSDNNNNNNEFFGIHLIDQQHQVTNILSLSANIEASSESKTLQFLRICNDLISTQLINISDIVDAINFKCEIDPENQEPDLDNQESDLENQESDLDNQESNLDNQGPNPDTVDDIDDINTNKSQPELDLDNLENILS